MLRAVIVALATATAFVPAPSTSSSSSSSNLRHRRARTTPTTAAADSGWHAVHLEDAAALSLLMHWLPMHESNSRDEQSVREMIDWQYGEAMKKPSHGLHVCIGLCRGEDVRAIAQLCAHPDDVNRLRKARQMVFADTRIDMPPIRMQLRSIATRPDDEDGAMGRLMAMLLEEGKAGGGRDVSSRGPMGRVVMLWERLRLNPKCWLEAIAATGGGGDGKGE